MAEKDGKAKRDRPAGKAGARGAVECPVSFCPVGMFLTATGQVRPDVVEHLLKAGREFILAAQALIEARADTLQREASLEKIELE